MPNTEAVASLPVTGSPDRLPARSVRVLAVLLIGALVVILNEMALNVALSRIMVDLSIDERTSQ